MLEFFTTFIAPVVKTIGEMASVGFYISLVILLVRLFADKRISPNWKYYMWILVLIALVIPYRPQSDIAFFKRPDEPFNTPELNEYYDAAKNTSEFISVYTQETIEQRPDLTRQYEELTKQEQTWHILLFVGNVILPIVYFLGFILLILYAVLMNIRLNRKVLKSQLDLPEKYLQIFDNCKQKLSIKADIQLVLQEHINFPALIGFCPKVILPKYIFEMNDKSVEYIFLHELSHYKRGDFVVNYILVVLKALYWWNPLTWLMFKFIRQDMETANDSFILNKLDEDTHEAYSYSLVEVLANYSKIQFAPKMLCMADDKKNMKRRINMLKLREQFSKRKVIISIVSILLMFGIGVLFLTTGVQTRTSRVDPNGEIHYYTEKGYILTKELLYRENDDSISIRAVLDLENSAIPETINDKPVTYISERAFYIGGYNRRSVYIPKTVTEIDIQGGAFRGATSLKEIIVDPENPNYSSVDGVLYNKDKTTLLICPSGKTGTLRIPEGAESFTGSNVFDHDSSIEIIVIPSTKKLILENPYYNSFSNCGNLASIEISPDNPFVTSVDGIIYSKDMSTLLHCPRGREGMIRIPEGVKKIDSYAFDIASFGWEGKLHSIYIPKSVTEISESAFGSYETSFSHTSIYITGYRGSAIDQYLQQQSIDQSANYVNGVWYSAIYFIPIDDLISE